MAHTLDDLFTDKLLSLLIRNAPPAHPTGLWSQCRPWALCCRAGAPPQLPREGSGRLLSSLLLLGPGGLHPVAWRGGDDTQTPRVPQACWNLACRGLLCTFKYGRQETFRFAGMMVTFHCSKGFPSYKNGVCVIFKSIDNDSNCSHHPSLRAHEGCAFCKCFTGMTMTLLLLLTTPRPVQVLSPPPLTDDETGHGQGKRCG